MDVVFGLVSQVASESTALVISRVVLQEFAIGLKNLEPEQHVKVAQIAIEKIQPRVVAFEDQISVIREDLSKVFEDNEQYVEAAKILMGIPLESGQRCVDGKHWSVKVFLRVLTRFGGLNEISQVFSYLY